MQLTKHFFLHEFTRSSTASRLNINNTPNQYHIENLKDLCSFVLEKVREHFKSPIIITSGFRCEELNKAIGGSPTSQHLSGEAADFTIKNLDLYEVACFIRDNLVFDQLILENYNTQNGWIHVSFTSRRKNRKSCLTFKNGRYYPGLLR